MATAREGRPLQTSVSKPELLLPTLRCSCPCTTLGGSNLTRLKLLNGVIGTIAVLTYIQLDEMTARSKVATQPSAPMGVFARVLFVAIILVPNVALVGLLWLTGWAAWVHERLHGVVMRCLGVQPVYGTFLRVRGVRGDYCMPSQPHLFGRAAFAAITLAPAVVLFTFGLALSIASPYTVVVTFALAWQCGSCSGDLWFVWDLLRAPRQSQIEDLGNTMVIHQSQCLVERSSAYADTRLQVPGAIHGREELSV